MPHLSPPRRPLPALTLALAALGLPVATAHAKLPPQMTYDVRVEASMTERWDFGEYSEAECEEGVCVRDEKGAGSAEIKLATRSWRLDVVGGRGKQPPHVDVGNEGGLPFKGEYRREGSHVTDYRGPWEAANDDQVESTAECGPKPIRTDVGFAFPARNRIQLTGILDDLRECPMGPPHNLDWKDGAAPSLYDVVVGVQHSKFARTKQFRISGQRTFTGTVEPFSRTEPGNTFVRSGSQETTWRWEATFRKAKRKRRG